MMGPTPRRPATQVKACDGAKMRSDSTANTKSFADTESGQALWPVRRQIIVMAETH